MTDATQGSGSGYMCPICRAPVRLDARSCASCGVQFAPPEEPPPAASTGQPGAWSAAPPAGTSGAPPGSSGELAASAPPVDVPWDFVSPGSAAAEASTARAGARGARARGASASARGATRRTASGMRRAALPFGNQDAADPYAQRRRLLPAGKVLLMLVIALLLAALLNADGLRRQAEAMDYGSGRSVMIGLTKPLTGIASVFQLSRMHTAMDAALGRGSQETAGVEPGTNGPTPAVTPSGNATGTPTAGPSAKPSVTAIVTPTRNDKLRLYIGGDSMAMILGQSLQAMATDTGVVTTTLDYKVSSGISRPDFFNWPKRIEAQMQSKFRPQAAVFIVGANDGQPVEYQGKVLDDGTPAWNALYARRAGAAMDALGDGGARQVFWVGMPNARNAEQSAIYRNLNRLAQKEAKKRPWVRYVDTYELFGDDNGDYSDYLTSLAGKTELVRQEDGIHWTRAGGDMAADAVLRAIAEVYKFDYPQ